MYNIMQYLMCLTFAFCYGCMVEVPLIDLICYERVLFSLPNNFILDQFKVAFYLQPQTSTGELISGKLKPIGEKKRTLAV